MHGQKSAKSFLNKIGLYQSIKERLIPVVVNLNYLGTVMLLILFARIKISGYFVYF